MKRRNKRKMRIRLFKISVVMLVIVSCVFSFSAFSKNEQPDTDNYEEVYVRPGDTLWGIAEEFYGSDIDIREAVYEIKKYNDLDGGMLSVGQKLLVPVLD